MRYLQGTVLFTQESRFTVEADSGERFLFILSAHSGVEPQQLPPLQHRQARIRVGFEDGPNVIAYTARRIEIMP